MKDGDLQGFLIDLIKELSKEAKFDYELYLRKDSKYQNMIDELERQVLNFIGGRKGGGGIFPQCAWLELKLTRINRTLDAPGFEMLVLLKEETCRNFHDTDSTRVLIQAALVGDTDTFTNALSLLPLNKSLDYTLE